MTPEPSNEYQKLVEAERLAALIESRIGQMFDEEAHLSGDEARRIAFTLRAALSALKLPPTVTEHVTVGPLPHAGDDVDPSSSEVAGQPQPALPDDGWQDIAGLKPEFGEVGWLIEEDAGGFIHWIALASDAWPRYDVKTIARTADYEVDREKYRSPVERVKDSNAAIRFARKEDADAFIRLFDRFLLCPKATEHCWPATTTPPAGVSDNV